MIVEGEPAPDFELQTDEGKTVRLADFRGSTVVLYFYPQDEPGPRLVRLAPTPNGVRANRVFLV